MLGASSHRSSLSQARCAVRTLRVSAPIQPDARCRCMGLPTNRCLSKVGAFANGIKAMRMRRFRYIDVKTNAAAIPMRSLSVKNGGRGTGDPAKPAIWRMWSMTVAMVYRVAGRILQSVGLRKAWWRRTKRRRLPETSGCYRKPLCAMRTQFLITY